MTQWRTGDTNGDDMDQRDLKFIVIQTRHKRINGLMRDHRTRQTIAEEEAIYEQMRNG